MKGLSTHRLISYSGLSCESEVSRGQGVADYLVRVMKMNVRARSREREREKGDACKVSIPRTSTEEFEDRSLCGWIYCMVHTKYNVG